jgi:serine/threonine-protein kinase
MALNPGARLGPYEVLEPIGAGGMGEVYRARDTKLNRDVALKVLPALFTDDPDRLARFEREARLLAALNHPNIAHVYGLEHGEGNVRAIAMEFVDGRTLGDVIGSSTASDASGLPFVEALPIARQIAAALETAHDAGIIHRDLKPANIKVRDDGTVKVLDFGLAKFDEAAEGYGGTERLSNSPTLTARATQLGMILGTAAYMAPEQAKGKTVDRRADVWAFGAVLFEMLSGRRAFDGDDVSEVMAAVLKLDPDWSLLPADVPNPVRRLLRRCLEKDPKKRLRDIGEGMVQLDEGLSGATAAMSMSMSGIAVSGLPSSLAATTPERPTSLWRRAAPALAVMALVALAAVAAAGWLRTTDVPAAGIVRFQHTFEPPLRIALTQNYTDLSITRDGRAIAFTGVISQQPHVFLRPIDGLQATPLRGGELGYGPFSSPDSEWIGFHDGGEPGRLKKVSIFGGPPIVLVKAQAPVAGASWTSDGFVVFGVNGSGLHVVGEGGGGTPTQLTSPDTSLGEVLHASPHAVPDSPVVLFTTITGSPGIEHSRLAALDRSTGRVVRFDLAGSNPKYLSSGHMIYGAADGSLRAVTFDLERLEISGNPVPVHDGIGVKVTGSVNYDTTADGHLVYVGGGGARRVERTVVWVDRAGRETPIAVPPRTYFYVRISPVDARLSLDVRDDQQDVWIWDPRGTLTRLTAGEGSDEYGLWTPDGRSVLSFSSVGGKPGLFRSRTDITGARELVVDRPSSYPNAVTPNGAELIFRSAAGGTKGANDLFVVPLTGDKTVRTLLGTEHDELNAAISPDGRWIAYQSDLSSKMEIYVSPYPDLSKGQWTISTAGGTEPVWSPAGRDLFYLAADGKIMAVPYTASPQFTPSAPVALFDASKYFFGGVGRNYDAARDGQRFVMVRDPQSGGGSLPISVVLNWGTEVRDRVRK